MGQQFTRIKQRLDKAVFDGNEEGISIMGARAIRVVVHAPAGQAFADGFSVRFALRHARTGIVLLGGGGTQAADTVLGPAVGEVAVSASIASDQQGVLVAEVPVSGDYDDTLLARVADASTSGSPADGTDADHVYIVLERLGTK